MHTYMSGNIANLLLYPVAGSCVASEQFLGNISSGGTDKVEETDPAVMWPVRGKVSNKCLADHYRSVQDSQFGSIVTINLAQGYLNPF